MLKSFIAFYLGCSPQAAETMAMSNPDGWTAGILFFSMLMLVGLFAFTGLMKVLIFGPKGW